MPGSRVRYSDISATLVDHISEFKGLPQAEIEARMRTSRDERNRRWRAAAPRTETERNRLYSELGELDLLKYAQWHISDTKKQRLHDRMAAVARTRGLDVLDCGGGIGDTTLCFALNGAKVTYVDFPGVCSDFARFRWRKYGCEDRISACTPEQFWSATASSFGMIASCDVLEHLEDPVRSALRYRDLLRPDGHLFVTAWFRHDENNPDHLPENDAYHRVFGGEPWTFGRCILTNIGFRRRRWYWFVKPAR